MKSLLYFLLSILMLFPGLIFAQGLELGVQVGGSNYLGDLSSNSSSIHLSETGFSGGGFVRYNINPYVGFRLAFNASSISGDDANASFESIQERNLNFRSGILEGSFTAEFNILGYEPYNLNRPFSPYIFGGIAFLSFNPRTDYEGQIIELQPLGTEGQGMDGREDPYKLTTLAIPFGLGVKYALNDSWNLGVELGARATFTDYLDDVSTTYVEFSELLAANGEDAAALGNRQGEFLGTEPVSVPTGTARGDNVSRDWYFILGVSISYNFLDNGLVSSRGRSRKKAGCKIN